MRPVGSAGLVISPLFQPSFAWSVKPEYSYLGLKEMLLSPEPGTFQERGLPKLSSGLQSKPRLLDARFTEKS